ncbi:MAG: winged helix-turn-helix domain-containing protein [Acidobacteriota bacterium]
MPETLSPPTVIRFGHFEVDVRAGQLLKRGVKVRLREQSFLVLSMLLEHAGEVVTREELQRRLWPGDALVDVEINLNTAVARLREALGDSAERPRFIETLPKHGYRFVATASEYAIPEPFLQRRVRLVVLPFANVSGDPAEEYFSDAMTDEIIAALCQVAPEHLAVIARTTAMHYKRSEKDVARIGRELRVDYVVEGGVRHNESRVTMNVQLIQVTDQTHVFARKYNVGIRELFSLHSRVAEDVATHIPTLVRIRGEVRSRRKPTENLLAYQLYRQGRHHMYKQSSEGLAKAKQCFEEAIAHDPRFALAYDALGELYWWTGFFGYLPPRDAYPVGLRAALRAVEIDPTLAETHSLLGQFHVRQKHAYNWPEVRREMTHAIELDPSSPLVRLRYAVSWLLPAGQLEDAVTHLEWGLELDPLSFNLHLWLSVILWLAREFDRAMREARISEGLDPESYLSQMTIGNIYRDSGMLQEAVFPHRRAVELSGGMPQMLGVLGLTIAQSGNTLEARSLLQRLQATASEAYVCPTSVAWIHVGLGEIDDAFSWMARAIDEGDAFMIPIKTYPFLDPLRADARFLALLLKMNLEP